MSSQIVDVAEAVVTSLNAATFTETFTATRKWIPKVDLTDLSILTVTIAPRAYERTNETRIAVRRNIQIDIGIQKLVETTTDATDPDKLDEIDGLMELVEGIADHFASGRYGNAVWVRTEIPEPMYDREVLDNDRVFQSVVTVTFTRT